MKSIKSIINEEIKILSESFIYNDTENAFKFKQSIINSYFYNYDHSSDYDLDITESNIIVNWHIEFWLNDLGIENFMAKVDNIEGLYILTQIDKHTDEEVNSIEKNINDIEWNFEYGDYSLIGNRSLYVTSLQFNFENNTCTVGF